MEPDTPSARYISPGAGDSATAGVSAQKAVFKEGRDWIVGYGGNAVRVKDAKGLGYIAHLLRHPTIEFHVLDLIEGIASQREDEESSRWTHGLPQAAEDLEKAGIRIAGLGDAGEMLDKAAKAAYRRRLSELRGELEEAKRFGKVERAEQLENEIDALTRELSRAVGLGGRDRQAASASERARQTVTKSIKAVLETIAQRDPTLADLLSRCIKTGNFCSYQPDPDLPIAWEFAEPITEPAEQPTSSSDPVPSLADLRQVAPVVLDVPAFSIAERTAFVGREKEHSTIRALIDRALSGHGSLVMLGGEPGVGKSRLAMEMAEYASRVGFHCVVGHCYESDEPFPYLPFVEIFESELAQAASLDDFRRRLGDNAAEFAQLAPSLRRVFPDVPQPLELPPPQKRRFLFQCLSEALARPVRARSYVYVLEDLHWADESTLALLIHLTPRLTRLPVVIIGTYRDSYLDGNQALVRTLEALIRMGIRPLKVGGLLRDAVGKMLDGLSKRRAPESLVRIIFEESQGNPFFVEELYQHLVEEGKVFEADGQFRTDITNEEIAVPENVRLVIGRRLERLDENEKRVLAAAAVIGRTFSFQLLAGITQINVDELFTVIEKSQQMGIVVPSAEGPERPFTFSHELVRQTLLAGVSAPRQQRLHADLADTIERLYPDAINERTGDIAEHLLKAGPFADERRLVHYLTLAGKVAFDAAAFEEAGRNFQVALSHRGAVGEEERAKLLTSLGMADLGLERWDTAFSNLHKSLDIYMEIGDPDMIGRCFSRVTDALIRSGALREAVELARRGLAYLPGNIGADRARLLAALAQGSASTGGYEPAHEALREGLNIASHLSDPQLLARLFAARSTVNFHFFQLKEAAADGFRSEQLSGAETSPWLRTIQLGILLQVLSYSGLQEEATRTLEKLEPLAKQIGQSHWITPCLALRALIEFGKAPDLTKLEQDLLQVWKPDLTAGYVFWEAPSEVLLSLVAFFRGEWADALLHAQAARRAEPWKSTEGYSVGALFRQMAYAGDRAGAFAVLDEMRAQLPNRGKPNTLGSWWMLALMIEGLVILGEQREAAELYPLACELVNTGAVALWSISRFTRTVAGMAAASAHHWKAAEDHFGIAMQQAESFPHLLEQADIYRFHAMMLLNRSARGDRESVRTFLSEALKTYILIGMPRHIEMVKALMD